MNAIQTPKTLIIGLGNIGMLYDLKFKDDEKIIISKMN